MLDKGRFLTQLGKRVTVNLSSETVTGVLRDIDSEFLILEVESGLEDENTETVYISAQRIVTIRFIT